MWCVWSDPCGLACYAFGWATIVFVDYALMSECVWPWLGGHWTGVLHVGLFQTLIALICASYLRAAMTDPGSVQLKTASRASIYAPEGDPQRLYKPRRRYCDKCEVIKPPRAHHCSTCKRCINKMDRACAAALVRQAVALLALPLRVSPSSHRRCRPLPLGQQLRRIK